MPLLIFPFVIAWLLFTLVLVVALRRWAFHRIASLEASDVLEAKPSGQRISIDGVLLHYVERGQGDPLVLIHGLDASTFSWRMNIDPLAKRFRVVAVDLLGFGCSQRAADADYSLGGHARRIGLLMDALNIPSAVIGGHSLGGAVAMHFATQRRNASAACCSWTQPRIARRRPFHDSLHGVLQSNYLRHLRW